MHQYRLYESWEPFPLGNFHLSLQYRQGSICPFSGFDATVAEFDSLITIGNVDGVVQINTMQTAILIYPNPATDHIIINFEKISA